MKELSKIAATDLGLEEAPRGSNKGPELQKFFKSDDLEMDGKTDGYPWCAAAVSYWVQQWIAANGVKLRAPRIAAVRLFPEWAKKNGLVTTPDRPRVNDIVVFTFSHIGVVEAVRASGSGEVLGIDAIEGNTNGDGSREGFEVARRSRPIEQCRLFIRLPAC
jgi:hypothetical protein